MRLHLLGIALLAAALVAAGSARADWVFRSSYYTHNPATGQRVPQFAQPAPAYSRVGAEGYLQSAYRHNKTTLRVGEDADHIHVVETWGAGDQIRPYGEWLYPYRDGATPYGPWGNPQGPWTLPSESWQNPYGLLQHSYPNYPQPTPPGSPMPYGRGPGAELRQPPGQSMPYGVGNGAAMNPPPVQ